MFLPQRKISWRIKELWLSEKRRRREKVTGTSPRMTWKVS